MKNLIYPQITVLFCFANVFVGTENVKNDMQKYPKPPSFSSLKLKKSEINLYVLLTNDVKNACIKIKFILHI